MERRGARVHRDAVLAAPYRRRDRCSKALGSWAGREPARAQRLDDGELVFCVDERLMKRQERGANRSPAAKRERLTRLDCHGISFIVGDLRVTGQLPRRPPARRFPGHFIDGPLSPVVSQREQFRQRIQRRVQLRVVRRIDQHVRHAERFDEGGAFGRRFHRVEERLHPVTLHPLVKEPVIVAEQLILVEKRRVESRKRHCLLRHEQLRRIGHPPIDGKHAVCRHILPNPLREIAIWRTHRPRGHDVIAGGKPCGGASCGHTGIRATIEAGVSARPPGSAGAAVSGDRVARAVSTVNGIMNSTNGTALL